MADNEKIVVKIDPDLEDLIPIYIGTKRKDIASMLEALPNEDYETIRLLGHSMKGSGGGYGFDAISEIGKTIEQAAKDKNDVQIKTSVEELSSYLERVEVVYE